MRSPYAICPVAADVARYCSLPDEVSDEARMRLITDLSAELAEASHWQIVSEHVGGDDATWLALSDALRRATLGGTAGADALGEIESLALAARDAVAEQIVDRYLRDNPYPPLPPARLLAKYPTGKIPQPDLLHARQLERAA